MAQIISDYFNRADAATLGANWTNATSGFRITGGKAGPLAANLMGAVYSGAAWTGGNDHYAEIVPAVKTSFSDIDVYARMSLSAGNITGYSIEVNDTDASVPLGNILDCAMLKVVANAFTQLGSSTTLLVNVGDIVRIEVLGTTVTGKVNGAIILGPTTDAAISTGKPGIGGGGSPTAGYVEFTAFAAGSFYETPRLRPPISWPTGRGPFAPRRLNLRHLAYQPKAFTLSGRTIDSVGNIVPNCVVKLYTTVDDIERASTTSDSNGFYSFAIGNGAQFYCVAYHPNSPDTAGTTLNTLVSI